MRVPYCDPHYEPATSCIPIGTLRLSQIPIIIFRICRTIRARLFRHQPTPMPTLGSGCCTHSKSEKDQCVPAARLSLILLWEFRTRSSSLLALLQIASTSTLAPEGLHCMISFSRYSMGYSSLLPYTSSMLSSCQISSSTC